MKNKHIMKHGDRLIVRAGVLVLHIDMRMEFGALRVQVFDDSGRQNTFYIEQGAFLRTDDLRINESGTTVRLGYSASGSGRMQVGLHTMKRLFRMGLKVAQASSFVEQVAKVQQIHDFMSQFCVYPPPTKWLLGGGEE